MHLPPASEGEANENPGALAGGTGDAFDGTVEGTQSEVYPVPTAGESAKIAQPVTAHLPTVPPQLVAHIAQVLARNPEFDDLGRLKLAEGVWLRMWATEEEFLLLCKPEGRA